jgi:hypothetical protein
MRVFTPGQLLWSFSLLTLVAGFPGADSHGDNSAHRTLHQRCPYAQDQEQAKPEHDKRFLFDLMDSPVDGMTATVVLRLVVTKT